MFRTLCFALGDSEGRDCEAFQGAARGPVAARSVRVFGGLRLRFLDINSPSCFYATRILSSSRPLQFSSPHSNVRMQSLKLALHTHLLMPARCIYSNWLAGVNIKALGYVSPKL